jgi:hypothetical protein
MMGDVLSCPACGDDADVVPAFIADRVGVRMRFAVVCLTCSMITEVDATRSPSRAVDLFGVELRRMSKLFLTPLTRTASALTRKES